MSASTSFPIVAQLSFPDLAFQRLDYLIMDSETCHLGSKRSTEQRTVRALCKLTLLILHIASGIQHNLINILLGPSFIRSFQCTSTILRFLVCRPATVKNL